jgi:hypothetical protein
MTGPVNMGQSPRNIEIIRVTHIDQDRSVVAFRVGDIEVGSLWVTGEASGRPSCAWPRTRQGYHIIKPGADGAWIDELVLAAVREARHG